MIPLADALALVRTNRWTGPAVKVPLIESLGHVLAQDVVATHDSPRFDNSAMDGYAVGSLAGPWTLIGEVAAGQPATVLSPGEAVRIFTGAPVPIGTYGVIPQEQAAICADRLSGDAVAGRHVRNRGEEFVAGTCVVPSGTRITPGVLGTIAGQGATHVSIQPRPNVALMTTGSELVAPGLPLGEGEIYESNGPMLESALIAMGCATERRHVTDRIAETIATGQNLLERSSLLITVGGVSVGDYDFAKLAAERMGFRIVFSEVGIKPGKPVTFGLREDGKAWFGLPGNPMSAMVTFLMFVREWLGDALLWRSLPIGSSWKSGDRDEFSPGVWTFTGVERVATIGSHALGGWVEADGLMHCPAGSEVRKGDHVQFAPLTWSRP